MSETNFPENEKNLVKISAIKKLYPGYTPDECAEAEYNLSRYLNLVERIYNCLERENYENIDDSAFKR